MGHDFRALDDFRDHPAATRTTNGELLTNFAILLPPRNAAPCVDAIDEQLLALLKDDARLPYVELAGKVRLSEAAVRRRIRALVTRGVIRRFTIEGGLEQGASALTLVSVAPSTPTPDVSRRIRQLKGIEVVYEITGEHDITALCSAPNIAEINRCVDEIRRVPGVATTNTVIILRTLR
jgi:DNA-binding Lrp family transcriptional regulator